MAERKEIFEYLRNKQKAAEIEAKVDGINLWVLFGAIAIVSWQLLGTADGGIWGDAEMILRTLLFAEGLYLLISWSANAHRSRDEVRYSQWKLAELESPFLVLLQGVAVGLPPTLSILYLGKSAGSIILGMLGLVIVTTSIVAISSRLSQRKSDPEKFPRPDFEPTGRADVLGTLLFGIAFSTVIAEQIIFFWDSRNLISVDIARQLSLLSALYVLIMVTVRRRLRSNQIAWTYELETELLLGNISAEVASRRIEHRALGPRLQDVMDRFFDDMDKRIKELDTLFEQCRTKLDSVKDVPQEYSAERSARIADGSQDLTTHIDALTKDCGEFGSYLDKLEEKNRGARRAALAPHLVGLRSRHKKYSRQLKNCKAELDRLLAGATGLRAA